MIDNLRVIETVQRAARSTSWSPMPAAPTRAPFAETTPAQFRDMFELNVMGVVHATQAVLGGMVERDFGRIVAIASTAGVKGYGYVSAYCAAKHAVVGLVRSLAIETAKTGVTVNAVCPATPTPT